MWTIRFRAELEADLRDGQDWYDSKVSGLGAEFLQEFWAAVDRISERPLSFAVAPNGLRPCRLRRFSYVVHYRVFDHEILIIAVMSAARDESAFLDRG